MRIVGTVDEAVERADCVVTDTWVSMSDARASSGEVETSALEAFRIDARAMGLARENAIFMHCMPMYRGREVSQEVAKARSRLCRRGGKQAACPEGDPEVVSGLNPAGKVEGRDDTVQPFQLGQLSLSGRVVRLGPALDRILSQHDYPDSVSIVLGELIVIAVVLGAGLKFEGRLTAETG